MPLLRPEIEESKEYHNVLRSPKHYSEKTSVELFELWDGNSQYDIGLDDSQLQLALGVQDETADKGLRVQVL